MTMEESRECERAVKLVVLNAESRVKSQGRDKSFQWYSSTTCTTQNPYFAVGLSPVNLCCLHGRDASCH